MKLEYTGMLEEADNNYNDSLTVWYGIGNSRLNFSKEKSNILKIARLSSQSSHDQGMIYKWTLSYQKNEPGKKFDEVDNEFLIKIFQLVPEDSTNLYLKEPTPTALLVISSDITELESLYNQYVKQLEIDMSVGKRDFSPENPPSIYKYLDDVVKTFHLQLVTGTDFTDIKNPFQI
jgi:hypothetical protein